MLGRRTFFTGLGAISVSVLGQTPAALGHDRMPWPDGKRAAVSLTYDDGLDSQLDYAAPQLNALDLKATFFLTKENMEARVADWIALAKHGHEIADHSNTHPCKLASYTSERYASEQIAPTEQFLDQNFGGPAPRDFAFPCGFTRLGKGTADQKWNRYLTVLKPTFLAARTVDGDPNDPRRVARDRYFLNAYEPTYDKDTPDLAFAYIRKAVAHGRWAILVFHDVLPKRVGEGDTSIAVHQQILTWLSEQPVWCAPMRQVFDTICPI